MGGYGRRIELNVKFTVEWWVKYSSENVMAEIKRNRRNTIERRCLGKAFKRLFVRSPKGVFKMLEKVKRA
jgi:hypothetical protein